MHKENESRTDMNKIKPFNKYLLFYDGTDGRYGVKGIRADAPSEAIDLFIDWYRDNNRYDNGRLRPEHLIRKSMIIEV